MIDVLLDNWPRWLEGAWGTIQMALLGNLLGSVLSLAAGLAMLSRFAPLRGFARTYTELFRGTSVVVQLAWFIFVLPRLGPTISPLQGAYVALGLNIGAYGAEVVRGAIQAVPQGQTEAAIALNMSPTQRMIRVILPQAVVGMLPPMGNLYIQLLKASAVAGAFLVTDLTRIANNIRNLTGENAAVFTVLLLIYFVIAYGITLIVRGLERLASRGMEIGREAQR